MLTLQYCNHFRKFLSFAEPSLSFPRVGQVGNLVLLLQVQMQ